MLEAAYRYKYHLATPQRLTTADPRNCRRYYLCSNVDTIQSPFPAECPPGQHYLTTTGLCGAPSCDLSIPLCLPNCIFEYAQAGTNQQLAHRTDCNKYYHYIGLGQPIEKFCPSGEYYDGLQCQADQNECCDPCMVYCEQAKTYIADPYDCTKFYYCHHDTYFPDATDHHSCPSGLFYDVWAHECSNTASCSQLCHPEAPYPPSINSLTRRGFSGV